MKRLILVCLVLSGCAGNFQLGKTAPDVSREEVTAAFQERDRAIAGLVQAVKELQGEKVKK